MTILRWINALLDFIQNVHHLKVLSIRRRESPLMNIEVSIFFVGTCSMPLKKRVQFDKALDDCCVFGKYRESAAPTIAGPMQFFAVAMLE